MLYIHYNVVFKVHIQLTHNTDFSFVSHNYSLTIKKTSEEKINAFNKCKNNIGHPKKNNNINYYNFNRYNKV